MRRRSFRCSIADFLRATRSFSRIFGTSLIPEVMARESQVLVERLAEMTRNRHRKFANTVFHLEPNVKDGPGGYPRLHHGALARGRCRRWKSSMAGPIRTRCFSPAVQTTMDSALAFLASVRCFLHFRQQTR